MVQGTKFSLHHWKKNKEKNALFSHITNYKLYSAIFFSSEPICQRTDIFARWQWGGRRGGSQHYRLFLLIQLDYLHWVTASKHDVHLSWKLHFSSSRLWFTLRCDYYKTDTDLLGLMPLLCSMEKLLNGMTSLTAFLFSVRDLTNATGSCPKHTAKQTLVTPHTHKELAPEHAKARGPIFSSTLICLGGLTLKLCFLWHFSISILR